MEFHVYVLCVVVLETEIMQPLNSSHRMNVQVSTDYIEK